MGGHGPFSGGEENVLRWLTGAGILATVAAMGIVLGALLRPRGRTPQAARWTGESVSSAPRTSATTRGSSHVSGSSPESTRAGRAGRASGRSLASSSLSCSGVKNS